MKNYPQNTAREKELSPNFGFVKNSDRNHYDVPNTQRSITRGSKIEIRQG